MKKQSNDRRIARGLVLNYVVLILATFVALSPFYVLVSSSLKSRFELAQSPLGLPPTWRFQNYPEAWVTGNFGMTMTNSLILVVFTVACVLLLGGMAAYGLARLNAPGGSVYMIYMLMLTTVPVWLYIVPLFINWRVLGLLNTLPGLIIIYIALDSPFAIFLLRSYMLTIPTDFEDAARVDGANEWQTFTKVIAPMMWPAFLTTGLVVALRVWGEFQIALVFLFDDKFMPVTTSYFKFQQRFDADMTLTSAGAVMMILPVLILFIILQRQFIAGLTQGGVKF